jgi:hypothetical protein
MIDESPPISPKTVRQPKRSRPPSRDAATSTSPQEDTGYDGDIEVVRPDEIEEPESESEVESIGSGLRRILWSDTDEDLASRMRRLGWRSKDKSEQYHKHLERPGARRLSKEADLSHVNEHGKRTELEVSEMVDGQMVARYAKRRKESKFNLAKRIIKGKHQAMSDTSEQTDGRPAPVEESSMSTPPDVGGDEVMDLD